MFSFEKVHITRNESHMLTVAVPAWEIPILRAVHGDANVQPLGTRTLRKVAIPPADVEFDRLISKYGRDREINQTYVELVYGNGGRGVEQLAAEMSKADEPVTAEQTAIEDLVGTVEGSAAL